MSLIIATLNHLVLAVLKTYAEGAATRVWPLIQVLIVALLLLGRAVKAQRRPAVLFMLLLHLLSDGLGREDDR